VVDQVNAAHPNRRFAVLPVKPEDDANDLASVGGGMGSDLSDVPPGGSHERILLALQGARRLILTDVATQLGLSNSTVHGLLQKLTAHGMVEQEAGSLRYMLGPAVLRLSSVYLDSLEFRSRTLKGWSEELARRTGVAVRAGVLLLGDVIVVLHAPRPDGSRQMPEVGFVMPAHASALGTAILAFRPRRRPSCSP
jgi:DNA-binding IclR family transcriptional regulator